MKVEAESSEKYVFRLYNRTIKLDKDMVDKYSDLVCPVDERFLSYMIDLFGEKKCQDDVLSAKIAFDMTRELSGYER